MHLSSSAMVSSAMDMVAPQLSKLQRRTVNSKRVAYAVSFKASGRLVTTSAYRSLVAVAHCKSTSKVLQHCELQQNCEDWGLASGPPRVLLFPRDGTS